MGPSLLVLALLVVAPMVGGMPIVDQQDAEAAGAAWLAQRDAAATCPDGPSGRDVVQTFDVDVSFEWKATFQQFSQMDTGWHNANDLLYDVTDGQTAYRKVDLWWNKKNWGTADVRVHDEGNYRAYTFRGAITDPSVPIHVGRDSQGAAWNSYVGAATLVHEWGHYAFWLDDEYVDGPGGSVPAESNINIMADGSTSEWCTATNHNSVSPGQEALSAWSQAVNHYAQMNVPAALPDPGAPGSAPDVEVVWHFPNLHILPTGLVPEHAEGLAGSTMDITIQVENDEGLVNEEVRVALYDGDPRIDGQEVAYALYNPSNEATSWVTLPYTLLDGEQTLWAGIDHDLKQPELDEDDNYQSVELYGRQAPLIATNIGSTLKGDEDHPLMVDFSSYASDPEDDAADLRWSAIDVDEDAIAEVLPDTGDGVLTFVPVANFNGKTDVTLVLTDSDGMQATKVMSLSFTALNDAPQPADIMLFPATVYRLSPLQISFSGVDVEDAPTSLVGTVGLRPSGDEGLWQEIPALFDGSRFLATLTPSGDQQPGSYDVRATLTDSEAGLSEPFYTNGSLQILDNLPLVSDDWEVVDDDLDRGQTMELQVSATDAEDSSSDLRFELEVSLAGRGRWRSLDATEFNNSAESDGGNGWILSPVLPLDLTVGPQDLRLRAIDTDGVAGEWVELSRAITVQNVAPSLVQLKAADSSIARLGQTTLQVVVSDAESPAEQVHVELTMTTSEDRGGYTEDGVGTPLWNATVGCWDIPFQPPHGLAPGDLEVQVVLTDQDGGTSTTEQLEVLKVTNNAPSIVATVPTKIKAGAVLRVDAHLSTDLEDRSNQLTYSWSFGDRKQPTLGSISTHSYSSAGNKVVTLTVTDRDGGKSTQTFKVKVESAGLSSTFSSGNGGSSALVPIILLLALVGVLAVVFFVFRGRLMGLLKR